MSSLEVKNVSYAPTGSEEKITAAGGKVEVI